MSGVSRDVPKAYLEAAISMLKARGLSRVVEIGSMRQPLEHSLDEVDLRCCQDGHSSVFLAAATDDLVTVDIDFWTAANAASTIRRVLGKNVEALCRDGIEFLTKYDRAIDLLFLDAWDTFLPGSAENHLAAFQAAEKNLSEDSLVLIDDTDVEFDGKALRPAAAHAGGKGRLLVPYMEQHGWSIVFSGRQTFLAYTLRPGEADQAQRELAERRAAVRDIVEQQFPGYYSD